MRQRQRILTVCSRKIGSDRPTFIIAEIGCNFEGSLRRAKEMVRAVAKAGADAVKFQTFIPEKLASKRAKKFWDIEGCPGTTQLEEFQQTPRLNFSQYKILQAEARRCGLIFFSTPSDEQSVDMLERLNVPLYKVSSMDITHIPLLKYIAKKNKPIILSTGASTMEEIRKAVNVIKRAGNSNIALLHCTTNYPTKDENVNLKMIAHMQKTFSGIPVGYSDHTLSKDGEGILCSAVALGAKLIEKHFTFDAERPGYDHAISADYEGLARIVRHIRRIEKALGNFNKKPISSELKARVHARRSIITAVPIKKGTILTSEMLEIKRPGIGIEPRFVKKLIGKKVIKDIKQDEVIGWDMITDSNKKPI